MKTLMLSIITILLLSGCGSSTNTETSDPNAANSFSLISGIYSWDDEEDGDEGYTEIKADGSLVFYDYEGDSFENGRNCYWIAKDYAYLIHNSGISYTINYDLSKIPEDELDEYKPEPITIEKVSEGIQFTGTSQENGHYVYIMLSTTLVPSDLTPNCEDL